MPLIFITLLSVYLLGNVYIFVKGIHALAHFPLWVRGVYSAVFWLCVLMLVISFAFRHASQQSFFFGHILFRTGSGWLVFTLYMIIFLACTDLVRLFNRNFTDGFVISLVLTIIVLAYGYINSLHTNKQVINIVLNKPLKDAKPLKIVAVSDLHLGLGTDMKLLHNNIDLINAEKPDVILIGGDLFDNSVEPVVAKNMDLELNRLQAPQGIYFCFGNHDYMSGAANCEKFISEKTDFRIIRDTVVTLENGLQILGRDDRHNRKRLSAGELQRLIDPALPLVIVDHQPVALEEAQQLGADLQFSGHTHHGQVIPLNWLTDRMFDIAYGFEKRGGVSYYVSSGLSLWGPPFRIGTNCEYVVFTVK